MDSKKDSEIIKYLLEKNFYLCEFYKVSFKDSCLTNNFNQTRFYDCYFRSTKFDNIKLVGAKFFNCNFKNAVFKNVDISFISFNRCYINFSQLKDCINNVNLKYKVMLTENLIANARDMNIVEDIGLIRDALNENSLLYYKDKALFTKSEHYSKRPFSEKLKFSVKMKCLQIKKLVFGFNLKIRKILFNILSLLIICTFVYFIIEPMHTWESFLKSLGLSFETLIGKNNLVYKDNKVIYIVNYIHTIFNYILYGSLLVAIIDRVKE